MPDVGFRKALGGLCPRAAELSLVLPCPCSILVDDLLAGAGATLFVACWINCFTFGEGCDVFRLRQRYGAGVMAQGVGGYVTLRWALNSTPGILLSHWARFWNMRTCLLASSPDAWRMDRLIFWFVHPSRSRERKEDAGKAMFFSRFFGAAFPALGVHVVPCM